MLLQLCKFPHGRKNKSIVIVIVILNWCVLQKAGLNNPVIQHTTVATKSDLPDTRIVTESDTGKLFKLAKRIRMMLQKHLSFRLSSFCLFWERPGYFKQLLSRRCKGGKVESQCLKKQNKKKTTSALWALWTLALWFGICQCHQGRTWSFRKFTYFMLTSCVSF